MNKTVAMMLGRLGVAGAVMQLPPCRSVCSLFNGLHLAETINSEVRLSNLSYLCNVDNSI